MRLTLNGHASVLAEVGDERVLVDPIFADSFASDAVVFHPRRAFDLTRLPEVTVVVVSHGHVDHFHPGSVARFAPDTTIVAPPDAELVAACRDLGFQDVVVLEPWQRWSRGGATLVATPSTFEEDELGVLLLEGDTPFYWHLSDTIVTPEVGERILTELGPVRLVGARYQPGTPLVSYQRGLGSSHDERDDLIAWLEAACAVQPAAIFPYSWGVAYSGRHAWANRYSAPYSREEIVRLLRARLGEQCAAVVADPGDVFVAGPSQVVHLPQASDYVRRVDGEVAGYEPVDTSTLAGLEDPADLAELVERLERYCVSVVSPFLQEHAAAPGGAFRGFADYGIVWQLVVHVGGGHRLTYSMDFRAPRLSLRRQANPDANYFVHLSGRALLDVLRGDAGAELFWMAADARYYEKVLSASPQGFRAPAVRGWELFDQLPDPLTLCLRKLGLPAGQLEPAAAE